MTELAKYSELKAGDTVRLEGFTCTANGPHVVYLVDLGGYGGLCIACNHGNHFLNGHRDQDGTGAGTRVVRVAPTVADCDMEHDDVRGTGCGGVGEVGEGLLA